MSLLYLKIHPKLGKLDALSGPPTNSVAPQDQQNSCFPLPSYFLPDIPNFFPARLVPALIYLYTPALFHTPNQVVKIKIKLGNKLELKLKLKHI